MPEAGIVYANESGTAEVQAFVSLQETKAFFVVIFEINPGGTSHETHQDF